MALDTKATSSSKADWEGLTNASVAIGKRLVAASCVALGLSACILITPPPARTFDLSAPTDIGKLSGRAGQLLIVEPSALQALAGNGIVVRPSAAELNYFPQAQWADNLPRLLQAKMQESFEATGRARAVGKPGDGLVIDYQVLSSLRAFEFDAVQQAAIVDLSVKIVDDRSGRVVGSQEFSASAVAASDSVEDAVFALDQAMDEVISSLVRWSLKRI